MTRVATATPPARAHDDIIVNGDDIIVNGDDIVVNGDDIVVNGNDIIVSGDDIIVNGDDIIMCSCFKQSNSEGVCTQLRTEYFPDRHCIFG